MKKEIPATFLHEDDKCFAIKDISPVAPFHYLVIPKKTIAKISEAKEEDEPLLGHLLFVAAKLAREEKLNEGFRIVINDSYHACQTVFQLHVHVIGGKQLSVNFA